MSRFVGLDVSQKVAAGGVSAPRFQTRSAVWCVEEVAFADVRAAMAQDHVRQPKWLIRCNLHLT